MHATFQYSGHGRRIHKGSGKIPRCPHTTGAKVLFPGTILPGFKHYLESDTIAYQFTVISHTKIVKIIATISIFPAKKITKMCLRLFPRPTMSSKQRVPDPVVGWGGEPSTPSASILGAFDALVALLIIKSRSL